MPPQVRFSREDILKAAFDLAIEGGISTITAQAMAGKLNSSVQPLYSNFSSVQELKQVLAENVCRLFREYVTKSYFSQPYIDIWVGELLFAKHFKNLYTSFLIERNSFEDSFLELNREEFEIFRTDAKLQGLTHDQLHALYRHMQIYNYGLCVMICNDYWIDQTNIGIIRTIREISDVTLEAVRDGKVLGRSHWFEQPEITLEAPKIEMVISFLQSDNSK